MNTIGGHPSHGPSTRTRLARALLVAAVLATSFGLGTPSAEALRSPNGPDSISVYRLYRAAFLREPDTNGLHHWYEAQLGGASLQTIASYFASSPEFVSRYGQLDDRAFVHQVYRNVFGREPDAGAEHWVQQLERGRLGRGGVLLGLADSAELKARVLAQAESPVDPSEFALGDWRWDPCVSSIDVYANFDHAPPFAEGFLQVALLRMSDVTGVEWRYLGPTDARSTPGNGFPFLDEMDPFAWQATTPILVEWNPNLPYSGDLRLSGVGGQPIVWINSAVVTLGQPTFESGQLLAGIATRELSQVFGLEPGPFPGNILDVQRSAWGWGVGDLEGFRELRRYGCGPFSQQ
jgi:hypothetical protein